MTYHLIFLLRSVLGEGITLPSLIFVEHTQSFSDNLCENGIIAMWLLTDDSNYISQIIHCYKCYSSEHWEKFANGL